MSKQQDKPADKALTAKDTPKGKVTDQAQPETVASVAKPKGKGKAKVLKVADVKALAVGATAEGATGVEGAGSAGAKHKSKFQAKKKATNPRGRGKK